MLEYDEPPVHSWSYTRLRDFEQCPYRVALDSVEKRPKPEQADDGPLNRGIRIHDAAEAYIKGEREDIIEELDKPKVVEVLDFYREMFPSGKVIVEEDWGFTQSWTKTGWWDEDVWLRLKIDAGVPLDDEGTAFLLDDWKSGKSFGKEVKTYEQGCLYSIGIMFRNPSVQSVKTRFVYTDENKIKEFPVFERVKMPPLIKRFTQRAMRLTLCTKFEAKPNRGNCHFCPFGPNAQGNNSCPHGIPW